MENDEIGKALVTLVGAVRQAWEAAALTSEPQYRVVNPADIPDKQIVIDYDPESQRSRELAQVLGAVFLRLYTLRSEIVITNVNPPDILMILQDLLQTIWDSRRESDKAADTQ